ncbi:sensor histidine kinase [Bdellovibrio sp. HCB337]|uniref:sensor histidine kinase n=1 Tax=Bdellovibrio sp. HCB337 TaxID=3394358 RepID=UPI0039A6EB02
MASDAVLTKSQFFKPQFNLTEVTNLEELHQKLPTPVSARELSGYNSQWALVLLTLSNSNDVQDYILRFGYPSMQNILIVGFDKSGKKLFEAKSGKLVPFSERVVADSEYLFPIHVPTNESITLAIELKTTGSMQFPFEIYSDIEMLHHTQKKFLFFGVYYGIILFILAYSLFIFMSFGGRLFSRYFFYILSVVVAQMSLHGIAYKYLWPDLPHWNKVSTLFFVAFMFFSLSQFTRVSLNTKESAIKIDWLLKGFSVFSAFLAIFSIVSYGNTVIRLVGIATSCLPLIFVPAGIVGLVKKSKFAPYYLPAILFYIIGASLYGLKDAGVLPPSFVTENGILLGSLLEVSFFSIGLGAHIRDLKFNADRVVIENKIHSEIANLATQMAHDIRSPLSALNLLSDHLQEASDEKRDLLKGSTQRINEIANSMLQKAKSKNLFTLQEAAADSAKSSPVARTSFKEVCENVLSEKMLLVENSQLQICLLNSLPEALVRVDAADFARALSNILNNSIEAIGNNPGTIFIKSDLNLKEQTLTLEVRDTGVGMSSETLRKVGAKGFTFGKTNGTGLGLHQVRATLKKGDGRLSIQSKVNEGTTITCLLPIVT